MGEVHELVCERKRKAIDRYVSYIYVALPSICKENPKILYDRIMEKISEKEVRIETLKREFYCKQYQKGQVENIKDFTDEILLERERLSHLREKLETFQVSS